MRCSNCGREIAETAKVCGYCGTRQTTPKPASQPPPTPPAPREESSSRGSRGGGVRVPVWLLVVLILVVLGGGFFLLGGPDLFANAPMPAEPTPTAEIEVAQEEPVEVEEDEPVPEPELKLLPASRAGNVLEEYPNIRDFTEVIDFNEILLRGGVSAIERQVFLQPTDSVRVMMGWCEQDWERLSTALDAIEIYYTLDGEPVSNQYLIDLDHEVEGLVCFSRLFVVEEWAPGTYLVEVDWIFTEDVYDSVLDVTIGAGEMHITYKVIVE